jgi:hypothetical protein
MAVEHYGPSRSPDIGSVPPLGEDEPGDVESTEEPHPVLSGHKSSPVLYD